MPVVADDVDEVGVAGAGAAGGWVDPAAVVTGAADVLAGLDVAEIVDVTGFAAAVSRLRAVVDGLWVRAAGELDRRQAYAAENAASACAWLRGHLNASQGSASAAVTTARRMGAVPLMAAAFTAGEISYEHLRAVTGLLVNEERLAAVGEHDATFLELARRVEPRQLRAMVAYWAAAADPEGAGESREKAHQARRLSISDSWEGRFYLDGQLDAEGGETVRTAVLAALGTPSVGDGRSAAQRRADALVDIARFFLDAKDLGEVGGERPHVSLTCDLDILLGHQHPAEAGAGAAGGEAGSGGTTPSGTTGRATATGATRLGGTDPHAGGCGDVSGVRPGEGTGDSCGCQAGADGVDSEGGEGTGRTGGGAADGNPGDAVVEVGSGEAGQFGDTPGSVPGTAAGIRAPAGDTAGTTPGAAPGTAPGTPAGTAEDTTSTAPAMAGNTAGATPGAAAGTAPGTPAGTAGTAEDTTSAAPGTAPATAAGTSAGNPAEGTSQAAAPAGGGADPRTGPTSAGPTSAGRRIGYKIGPAGLPWLVSFPAMFGVGASFAYSGPTSLATAERYLCDCALTRIVLAGRSEILDVGRERRLFTKAQRKALAIRDQGCVYPYCDKPPALTEAHHLVPWEAGGPTDLANAALLCRFHHRCVHEGGETLTRDHEGRIHIVDGTSRRQSRKT